MVDGQRGKVVGLLRYRRNDAGTEAVAIIRRAAITHKSLVLGDDIFLSNIHNVVKKVEGLLIGNTLKICRYVETIL